MQYLQTYCQMIRNRGNAQLADSLQKTAEDIGGRYLRSFSFKSHETGLLFGNVQSGKTAQMFAVVSKAADLGFPAFVLLTTDNIVLQQQTLERVKSDLTAFCICGENDAGLFIQNSLIEPVVVVLKKNARVLKLWANIFSTTAFMKGNPLFIADDEADAASLNTLINKNRQSSVSRYIDSIKNSASSSLYLQVTGTPQAVFLQTAASGRLPYFTYYFRPGSGYLGGDFFFPADGVPDCIQFLEETADPVRSAVVRHLAVSAQILASGGRVSSCMFHPSVRQADHQQIAEETEAALSWCRQSPEEFNALLQKEYAVLRPQKSVLKPFDNIAAEAQNLLNGGELKVLIMNGRTDVDSTAYSAGCCFVVGGNTLGRGVTFPGLQTICYTRSSKNPQADTMWQHSRMFGYDRDPGMMKIFMDMRLYKLFSDINAVNNAVIAQAEQGLNRIKIYCPEGLQPTRKNVLDKRHVEIISGGVNYYPYSPGNDSTDALSDTLSPFSETEPYYQVSLRLFQELLQHIIPSPDFRLDAFSAVIAGMLAETPAGQGILIVRRNRDVAQGTGALLSPNDWKLGGTFTDKTVLTMYQVTGTKGWGGRQLWVPNIKLPHGMVYYNVAENSAEVRSGTERNGGQSF